MQEKDFFSSSIYTLPVTSQFDNERYPAIWSFWHTGTVIGLVGAFIALFASFGLTLYAWFTGQGVNTSIAGQIGSWLIIAFFTLLLFGGCCMDKVESAEKEQKERLRKQKLTRK